MSIFEKQDGVEPLKPIFKKSKYLHVYVEGTPEMGGYIYAKYPIPELQHDIEKLIGLEPTEILELLGKPILAGYEVFFHRIRPETTFQTPTGPVVYPKCIPYPTDSDFAHTAWACSTIERCRERLEQRLIKLAEDEKKRLEEEQANS